MEYETTPSERTSREVLMAVSEAENTPWESLPALSEVVDPDALNELVESRGETDEDGHVSFVFSDSLVSLDCGDYIRVEARDDRHVLDPETGHARSLKAVIDREWQKLNGTDTAGRKPNG